VRRSSRPGAGRRNYRGPLLIHAAKGFTPEARSVCYYDPFRDALEGINAIEHAFGNYGPARSAWQLTEAVKFPNPIPCLGSLGLWKLPEHVVESLRAWLGERVP
jgi:hypothetical protein